MKDKRNSIEKIDEYENRTFLTNIDGNTSGVGIYDEARVALRIRIYDAKRCEVDILFVSGTSGCVFEETTVAVCHARRSSTPSHLLVPGREFVSNPEERANPSLLSSVEERRGNTGEFP